jgi:hypothetical protein
MVLRSNTSDGLRARVSNRPTFGVELPMPTMNRGSSNAESGEFKTPGLHPARFAFHSNCLLSLTGLRARPLKRPTLGMELPMPTSNRRSSEREIGWFQNSVATSGESRLSLTLPLCVVASSTAGVLHCPRSIAGVASGMSAECWRTPAPTVNRGGSERNRVSSGSRSEISPDPGHRQVANFVCVIFRICPVAVSETAATHRPLRRLHVCDTAAVGRPASGALGRRRSGPDLSLRFGRGAALSPFTSAAEWPARGRLAAAGRATG